MTSAFFRRMSGCVAGGLVVGLAGFFAARSVTSRRGSSVMGAVEAPFSSLEANTNPEIPDDDGSLAEGEP